jgi:hypothetical protein
MDETSALLHGDEHARAGRAPGHRDGDRASTSSSCRSAPPRARSSCCPTRGRGASAGTPSSADQRRGPAVLRALARRSSPSTTRLGAPACGSTRASTAGGGCPPTTTRCSPRSSCTARTRPEAIARMRAGARRVHRRRHPHEHPPAPGPAARPRGPRRHHEHTDGRTGRRPKRCVTARYSRRKRHFAESASRRSPPCSSGRARA